jgi:anti-anti-sigma factor
LKDFEKIYVDGVYVIAVNLTRSTINQAFAFRKIVEEEIKSGHTKLVIDLSKCNSIDSTFFGAIMMALEKTNDIGKKLKVVEPVNAKESIFILTNTLELFDLYKTREDALKSFEIGFQPNS